MYDEWQKLRKEGYSISSIARISNCSETPIDKYFKSIGIDTSNISIYNKNTHKDYLKLIKKSGKCWEWQGRLNNKGYGQFRINGKPWLCHRYSYQFYIGVIPVGGQVLHKCDNPKCANPAHLFLGNCSDNMVDRLLKGRQPNSKLVVADIVEIREKSKNGVSTKELSKKYNVCYRNIRDIVRLKSWKFV
jgi:hypothetical protein